MSTKEQEFLEELEIKFDARIKEFKEEADRKYARLQTFLLSILITLLAAVLAFGGTHISKDGETRSSVAAHELAIKQIQETAISQKAIDRLIVTFENQNKVMEEFFPENIKEGIKKMNEMNANTRSQILMFNSSLITRGGESGGAQ